MALKIIDYGTPEYQQMVKLRDDILRKPLGLRFSEEELSKEKENTLIAAFDEDLMLGCCMLVDIEPTVVRLRQMAVMNNLQRKGIGRSLMNFAENLARDKGCKKITMHARDYSAGFYEKVGYKIIGDSFIDAVVPYPHFRMEKDL